MVRVYALVFTTGGLDLSAVRTVLLVLGAMASVTVAVMSLLFNRIKQSGRSKHAGVAAQRPPRLRGAGVTIAALLCAGAFVVAIWVPLKTSDPLQDLTPQP